MADRKIYIEIITDDKGAKARLVDLDRTTDKLNQTANKLAGGGLSRIEIALGRATGSLVKASFYGNLLSDTLQRGIGMAVNAVSGTFGRAIELSNEYTKAMIGLSSVANAFGQDAGKAKQAAIDLAKDGLMTVAESAASLKNLLATRFNLPEAIQLMNAFKDSAAFNRQGMLAFGQAIVGATGGLKNQMSMMVDNVGITKNLTNIIKEQGFAEKDLANIATDGRVRQALLNGILKEAAAFKGNAAQATKTYEGALSRLNVAYDAALTTWGNAVTQNETVVTALNWVTEALINSNAEATKNGKAWYFVSDAVITVVKTMAGLLVAFDYVQLSVRATWIAVLGLSKAMVNVAGLWFKLSTNILEGMSQVPGGLNETGKQALAESKAALADLESRYNDLTTAQKESEQNSVATGNSLQGYAATLNKLAASLELTRGKSAEYGKTAPRITEETKKAEAAAKGLDKSLGTLMAKLDGAAKFMTAAQMVSEFGDAAQKMQQDLLIAGKVVPERIRLIAEAATQLELEEMNVKLAKGGSSWEDFAEKIEVSTKRIADAITENALALKDATDDIEQMLGEKYATPLQKRLLDIERQAKAATAAVNRADPATAARADEGIQKRRQVAIDLAWEQDTLDQIDRMEQNLKDIDKAAREAAYGGLMDFFTALGQINGGKGIGQFMQAAGGMVAGLRLAAQQAKMLGKNGKELGGSFGTLSTVFNSNATGAQRLAAGIATAATMAQGAMAVWDATAKSATRMGNAMNGAMAGAEAGAAFGPWGMAVGAAAGLVVGLIRGKPAWAKAADEVARDFGVKISDELAKTIANNAKTLFKGNRQAASLFSLSDIIKEDGGLNSDNLAQMTARLRDVFVMLETGAFSAAQATQVLDENWAEFARAGTNAHGQLSQGLREIIALQKQMGVESQAITAYLKEQALAASSALNLVLESTSWTKEYGDAVKEAQKEVDKLKQEMKEAGKAGKDMQDELDRAQNKLTEALTAQFNAAKGAKEELDAMGLVALGVYAAAIAAGLSHAEALKAAGPGLKTLSQAYKDLGLDVEDVGVKGLLMQSDLQTNIPNIINGVSGLAGTLTHLANSNALTATTFRATETSARAMYTRIQAEVEKLGGTSADALIPMQDYLHAAEEEAKRLGITLDPFTQMLIDQSKEAGIWKDRVVDPFSTVTGSIQQMVLAVDRLTRALRGLPDEVPDPTRNWTPPTGPNGPGTTPPPGMPPPPGEPPSTPAPDQAANFYRPAPVGPTAADTFGDSGKAPVTNNMAAVVVVTGAGATTDTVVRAVGKALPGWVINNADNLRVVLDDTLRK